MGTIANYSVTLPVGLSMSSDADYRALGSQFENIFTALGFERVADTGQANWTTDTRIVVTNSWGKYALFTQTGDALRTSHPMVIGFRIGTSNSITNGHIQFVVASGTTGTGAPSGVVRAWHYSASIALGFPAGTRMYASTDGDGGIVLQTTQPSRGSLIVERTRDSSGGATGDGFFFGYSSVTHTGVTYHAMRCFGVNWATGDDFVWQQQGPFNPPFSGTGGADPTTLSYTYDGGTKSAAALLTVFAPGCLPWVLKQIIFASQVDGLLLPATVYGVSNNYYMIPSPTPGTGLLGVGLSNNDIAVWSSGASTLQPAAMLWS